MADSNRSLFLSAGGGYVTPTLVRWSSQGQITLPGDTWFVTLGWFLSTVALAALASLFVLHIWKEKTAKRAFIAGLVLPYVLSGVVADVGSIAKVRRLGAQPAAQSSGAAASLTAFKVDVIGADTDKPLPGARMGIYRKGGDPSVPIATSTTTNAGGFAVPPGQYTLQVGAPGYDRKTIDIDLNDPKVQEELNKLTIKLKPSPWYQQFWFGAKSAALPQRLPMELQ